MTIRLVVSEISNEMFLFDVVLMNKSNRFVERHNKYSLE